MSLTADDLVSNAAFFRAMQTHAGHMTTLFAENPRLYLIFASQQRWLMAQLGLSLYYGRDPLTPETGLYTLRFVAKAIEHGIASRNTASAFINEMLAYRFARVSDNPPNRRMRPLEPTETAVEAVVKWLTAHLAILDAMDGGGRVAALTENPALFASAQPAIAQGILENKAVRDPGETFSLFTWANSGGLVMDCFIGLIRRFDATAGRTIIGPVSSADICRDYRISKTHLKRLMDKAAGMGSLGYDTSAGKNMLWLSQAFVREYLSYQAEKLALIDAAFETVAAPKKIAPPVAIRRLTAVP